ncbi:ribose 5-phosphate isomerase B [Blattabacterium cuenoti]|uniref:ribose 5-phosphate isomerase B n=1 Tax=Blattabacterium cuenoti TaxID=1653831 RepID=UPI00163CCCC6|nr:ribose 5-phosphate isomerase B [Blattabacterium cuenoti]
MIIAIGSDHTGIIYRCLINDFLKKNKYKIEDFGLYTNKKVDYPDYVHPVAKCVESGGANCGIIICGSGNGAAMTANKYKNIRAALVWNKEIASLARKHNNANIISLPARFLKKEDILDIIKIFLNTKFDGGRHQIRIEKIPIKNNPQ